MFSPLQKLGVVLDITTWLTISELEQYYMKCLLRIKEPQVGLRRKVSKLRYKI